MKLSDADVRSRDVLTWKGIHILHFAQSSCSQKLRIFLNLKAIDWEPHHIDLMANENVTPWFLGINPRGLVPVLVHDGAVHIESNDILIYLESLFPEPPLIPSQGAGEIAALLKHEDELHMDLRNLSFRFVFAPPQPPKSAEDIEVYGRAGSGSVGGARDAGLDEQLEYWRRYLSNGGITDEAARASALKFRAAFDELEARLTRQTFLFDDSLSVLDIAWFIYVDRLVHAGYPMTRLHPCLAAWFDMLSRLPAFAQERQVSGKAAARAEEVRVAPNYKSLEAVAGF
jgi:glutathione S-transferase